MNTFQGKKALCFIALPHHSRFLMPVMGGLKERGVDVRFFTAAAEAAFEITLNRAGVPYTHAFDYLTEEVQRKANAAYRELRSTWFDKVLNNPFLQAIPMPIQDKVIRNAIEDLFCFDRLLEVEKPDLVVALHELNPWGKTLGYLSQVHRVPYLTFQEGFSCDLPLFYRFHTDYSTACVLWGEAARRVLLASGSSSDKIFLLGSLHIWEARERASRKEAMDSTREALKIGADKKVVLFLMSHNTYETFKPAQFFKWLREHRDVTVIFKWHPATEPDTDKRVLNDALANPSIRSVHDFDTYSLIGISDVCVVVGQSTSGVEALAFGKPLIEIHLAGQFHSYADHGAAERSAGFEDIGDRIEEVLSQGLSPERREKVEAFLSCHFAFRDTKTLDRVMGLAGEMLKAKEDKERGQRPPLFTQSLSLSDGSVTFPCSIVLPVDDSPPERLVATLRGIAAHVPPELFELLIVNTASNSGVRELLFSLEGDVRVISGEPGLSFSSCCNLAAGEARGKRLLFLKPGLIPCPEWLEGLLGSAEGENGSTVIGGRVVNENGLIWHLGVAFDINQSPFSLYFLLPAQFAGANKKREFKAVQVPFLVSRDFFCRLGGFDTDLVNRFEDIDFCMRAGEEGSRVIYTPKSTILRGAGSWEPTPGQDQKNRVRFFARWAGYMWQDDERYLAEDDMDHDRLTALYRRMSARVAVEAQSAMAQAAEAQAAQSQAAQPETGG